MARANSRGNNNGAASTHEQATPEAQAEQAPPPEPQGEGNPENPAPVQEAAQPEGEPGPEDFARHSGARLREDHARDLALQVEIERRLLARADAIARRLQAAGPGATIEIGGKTYEARAKARTGGEVMALSEVRKRVPVSLE